MDEMDLVMRRDAQLGFSTNVQKAFVRMLMNVPVVYLMKPLVPEGTSYVEFFVVTFLVAIVLDAALTRGIGKFDHLKAALFALGIVAFALCLAS